MTKAKFLTIAASVYCGCLLISNIIAGKTFDASFAALPCAVILFPIVYILNDVLTEVYGFKTARTVVLTGFGINVLAVAAYAATLAMPSSAFFTAQDAFAAVLGSTPRLLAASLLSYLVGSLVNAKIMDAMRKRNERGLMLRCIASTAVGETLDATMFITIAFAGTMPIEALMAMVVAQAAFKTLYEVVAYPLTRVAIRKAKALAD